MLVPKFMDWRWMFPKSIHTFIQNDQSSDVMQSVAPCINWTANCNWFDFFSKFSHTEVTLLYIHSPNWQYPPHENRISVKKMIQFAGHFPLGSYFISIHLTRYFPHAKMCGAQAIKAYPFIIPAFNKTEWTNWCILTQLDRNTLTLR